MEFEQSPKHAEEAWIEKYRSALEHTQPERTRYEKLVNLLVGFSSKASRLITSAPTELGDKKNAIVADSRGDQTPNSSTLPGKRPSTSSDSGKRAERRTNSSGKPFRSAS